MKTLLHAPHGERNFLPGNCRRIAGFSLTELLVVVALIAIMAAMLLPAVSKAKLQVTTASCFGNQKQLATAFHMYAQDNADRIIQMADYETGDVFYPAGGYWGGPAGGPRWHTADEALRAVETGLQTSNAFYFYCGKVRMYHCPADLRVLRHPTPGHPNGWGYDSYSRTQNVGGDPEDDYFGAGATYTRMSAIAQPGTVFSMIEDADGLGFNGGAWALNWFDRSEFAWRRPPAIWHVNVTSVSYADGHTELHQWQDSQIISGGRRAGAGLGNRDWFGPTEGPDHEFVFKGYQFPGHP